MGLKGGVLVFFLLSTSPNFSRSSESVFQIVADWGITFFQKFISPQDGPVCRYSPTCSLYMQQAIKKHGFLKGLFFGLERLIRDNPFQEGGIDPVP